MVGNSVRPASAQQVPAKRLVCAACDTGDISPDGHMMVAEDYETGDIAIRDLSTGRVTRLFAKPGTYKDSAVSAEAPIFSPDLRQIAYWWGGKGAVHVHQLRVMPNEPGAKPRVLVDNPENLGYQPLTWSPDGKSVFVMLYELDFTSQLARVSVSDGTVRVLKSLQWRFSATTAGKPRVSPDGRYIVYPALAVNPLKYGPNRGKIDAHIYVLAADGSTESEVVKTAGNNENPAWTPDGKHILFTSDRSGKVDLWSIAIENGKAAGAASLVSSDIGQVGTGSMHGSSYYYPGYRRDAEYVNIAEFTPVGDNQSRIAHATESFVGIRPTWSPDGKSISFKKHHPGSSDGYDLVVHSLETGDERTYLTNLGTSGNGGGAWFHDGKTIMMGIGSGEVRSLYGVDLKTGEFRVLPSLNAPCALSPDDRTHYCVRNETKDWATLGAHIQAADLISGQEKEIFTMPEPGYSWFLLTPDGRTFVVRRQDWKTQTIHFARLNVDGRGYREIYTIAQRDFNDNFTLTKDSHSILLAKRQADKSWQLLRIPMEGGAPESTGVVLDPTLYQRSLDLSPDGSRIAFTTSKRVEELWALDNVLAALK
jgi:Tol biopolymer transport system component